MFELAAQTRSTSVHPMTMPWVSARTQLAKRVTVHDYIAQALAWAPKGTRESVRGSDILGPGSMHADRPVP